MIKGIIGYHHVNNKKNIVAVTYDTEKVEQFRTEKIWGTRVPIENESFCNNYLYFEFNEIENGVINKKKNIIL